MRKLGFLVALGATVVGCGGSSTPTNTDMATTPTDGGGGDSAMLTPTTTIAMARGGNVMTDIVVEAIVTGVRGNDPKDTREWYIEDAAGGANSGVVVYCNHTAKSNACPASVVAPNPGDKVIVAGKFSTYKGRLELDPTAQVTEASGQPLPAPVAVNPADLSPTGMSMYRGVYVKLNLTGKLTVDSVTPAALYDTKCAMADGGMPLVDGGMIACSGCSPPTYAGFQANDGAMHEVLVETYFYASENLASSPECLTQKGAVPVMVGTTFSSLQGILDFDSYGMVQYLAPITDSDYKTP